MLAALPGTVSSSRAVIKKKMFYGIRGSTWCRVAATDGSPLPSINLWGLRLYPAPCRRRGRLIKKEKNILWHPWLYPAPRRRHGWTTIAIYKFVRSAALPGAVLSSQTVNKKKRKKERKKERDTMASVALSGAVSSPLMDHTVVICFYNLCDVRGSS